MSEWVSWESCPQCGAPVAIGWRPASGTRGQDLAEPVQSDCLNGCQLSEPELAAFGVLFERSCNAAELDGCAVSPPARRG